VCQSVCTSLITDLKHSTNLNTFRSVINTATMSSSSNDELPEIPGTRYSWMVEEGESTSSRSPRKTTKKPRLSAVEKEKKTYKRPKNTKKTLLLDSSDDDFMDPQPGPSKPAKKTAEEVKKTKANERLAL